MSTQFEFRLIDASAPDGELEAEQLMAIVASLKEVATKIGRIETDAKPVGRAPKRTQRVAGLTIGMARGSTRVLARRTSAADSLDLDLAEEQEFDDTFARLIEAIASNERPEWVSDSLSRAAASLTGALKQAAPEVEFTLPGRAPRRFKTRETNRETWQVTKPPTEGQITFTGRLYVANLNTHRLRVQDDIGHHVTLPSVTNEDEAAKLIGTYVTVTGSPHLDKQGRLSSIHDAVAAAAADPLGGAAVPDAVPLDEILRSAPGPIVGSGLELSDEEFDSFLDAVRGM